MREFAETFGSFGYNQSASWRTPSSKIVLFCWKNWILVEKFQQLRYPRIRNDWNNSWFLFFSSKKKDSELNILVRTLVHDTIVCRYGKFSIEEETNSSQL